MANEKVATPEEMFELVSGRRTDDPSWFAYGDVVLSPRDVIEILGDRITEQRLAQFHRVVADRTRNVAVVVEGMVDLGNVGAVMRSADGFGVQEFHAIDTADAFKRSRRTSQGTDKWLDRQRWVTPAACADRLHRDGYRVVALDLEPGAVPLDSLDLTSRVALVFGNELEGISAQMRASADERAVIPMAGFAESFNISVAAAVALSEVRRQRVAAFGSNGDLDPIDRERVLAVWYLKTVRESELIVARALADGYEPAGIE